MKMKKQMLCILAIGVAIAASSFTSVNRTTSKATLTGYQWWDYHGGLLEQCDPAAYTPDPNNIPDCPTALGLIPCEVYALPSEFDPFQPDLNTVTTLRMKSLL